MFIPCILICFVFGYGVCSELNGTRVIHRESEEHGVFHCIPRICPKNSHAILCTATDPANPGKDKCMPCEENTLNPRETNTSTFTDHIQVPLYEVCRKPDCNCVIEARITNLDECLKTGNANCECNHDKGFCGDDPKTCEICDGNITDPNYDSLAGKCKPGYFKDTKGNGPCSKHRNCSEGEIIIFNGNSTMDRQCGPSTETRTTTENPDKILVIIGSVVGSIVLLAVIILGVWMGRKKFGKFIQRMKNAVLNNGVNDQLNIPEEQNGNAEPSEDTSMV